MLVIIVACPKTRGAETTVESTDIWSFLTFKTIAEVIAAIGRGVSASGLFLGAPGTDVQGKSISLQVLRTPYWSKNVFFSRRIRSARSRRDLTDALKVT